ncbi:hypothetical protein AGMMS49587_19970 [Spirochaetia bacterium]|nr:hypothetical protein AGMMS49587_19970 [Spirochaetia bacterium]
MSNKTMKSKVFTLGNKLALRTGGDRRAAFIEAWSIVKAGAIVLPVRGVMAGNRQEALRRLAAYDPADVQTFLFPEPENPRDQNAIAVMVGITGGRGFYKLGYIPATRTGIVSALRGKSPTIRVLGGDIRGARITLTA